MATTSVKEMREARRKGMEVKLPDYGDVVRIKPLDAEYFFKSGKIPDFLIGEVMTLINDPYNATGLSGRVPVTQETTGQWLKWLDELIMFAFVEPKVVSQPENDDEIGVDEISYFDKLFIYRLFGHPAYTLRNFRPKQDELMATMDTAKDNRASA